MPEGQRYDMAMLLRAAFEELVRLVDARAASHECHFHLEKYPELIGPCHATSPPVLLSTVPLGSDLVVEFVFMAQESETEAWWLPQRLWIVQFGPPSYQVFTDSDDFTDQFLHECSYAARCGTWAEQHRDDLPHLYDRLLEAQIIRRRPDTGRPRTFLIIGRRSETLATPHRHEKFFQRVSEAADANYHIRSWDGFFEKWVQKHILDKPLPDRIQCARFTDQGLDLIENEPLRQDDDSTATPHNTDA